MANYTMDEVKIEGEYPVEKILELSMNIGVNRHGELTYGALVSGDEAERYIRQDGDKEIIKIYLRDELEFCGYPQEISVSHENEHYYFRITLVGASQFMDIEPRSRFFQDTTYTFAEILTETYEDSGIGNLVAIRGKGEIETPILQYRETDWQFTLRMASRLGTVIIPNITAMAPQVALGVPKRHALAETNNIVYSFGRNAAEYRRKYATEHLYKSIEEYTVGYHSFLHYQMKSDNRYKLGDSVTIDGATLTVMEKTLEYEQGQIRELYTMGYEQEFAVPFHHNKRIAGLELEGKVLERDEQELQILLDIDAGRKDCGKTWFSYAPVTNNGMYSMPLKDEKVMLKWHSEADDDILALRPVRKNSTQMPHHGERHFLTEHENHLMMVPGKIEFTNPASSMKWLVSRGFDISTINNLLIEAQGDVIIKSKKQIEFHAPERININKAGINSSIDMIGNELHIAAAKNFTTTSRAKRYKMAKLSQRQPRAVMETAIGQKLIAAAPEVLKAKERKPKYSEEEIKAIVNNLKGDGFKNNPLRQAYEKEVTALTDTGEKLLKQGMPKEEVAETLHQMRRDLGVKYKDATPQPLRDYIYEVNQDRYGDPLGLSFEKMLEIKSFDEIIASSSKPNTNIDRLLSSFEQWLRRQ